jgi:hypothetical protein
LFLSSCYSEKLKATLSEKADEKHRRMVRHTPNDQLSLSCIAQARFFVLRFNDGDK